MTNVTIENVSDTAFWVAHYRGVEGKQKSPLFEDPLAAVLAGERGRRIAESMPRPFITAWVISVRTRLIDDLIRGCLARGVDTVLNLGAGLDTRAYRMDLPSTLQWIEADYPAMIEYKERLLAKETPRFQLTRVKCDLANDAERRALLANANAKSGKMLVLTEGVIPYLTNDQVGTLADDLRVLDHAAFWIVDYFSSEVLKFRHRTMSKKTENAPFLFQPADWTEFFRQHRWSCEKMLYLGEQAERLQRKMQLPVLAGVVMAMRALFVPAERRNFKNDAGYALLVPD